MSKIILYAYKFYSDNVTIPAYISFNVGIDYALVSCITERNIGDNMKLISGQQNALRTICKPGYAEGVSKPRREVKVEVKPVVIKIRRNERLVA